MDSLRKTIICIGL